MFSATRRSLARRAMALTSLARGARSTSRAVSRTGLAPAGAARGLAVLAESSPGLLRKIERGSRHPGLPFFGAHSGPPVRLDAGRPRMIHRITGQLPRSSEVRKRRCGPWFWYGTRLCRRSTRTDVWSLPSADIPAGMPFGAALTRDDVAGNNFAAAENLQTQAAGRPSRGRCVRSRLLSCVPSLASETL